MGQNYWCTPHDKGWQVKGEGNEQASSVHETQAEAWEETRRLAREARSEALLQGEDGQIRERSSYGNDPRSVPG